MRWAVLLAVDVALVLIATVLALILRENFEVSPSRLAELEFYLLSTLIAAFAVFPAVGLNRRVWRFSNFHDYLAVVASVGAVVVAAVGVTFAYNRLDGVARSIPFLQFLTGTVLLTGARVLHRLAHEYSHHRKAAPVLLKPAPDEMRAKTVLVVGITRLAEAYLRASAELSPGCIKIAGVVSCKERHTGRLLTKHRVLGHSENLTEILDALEVHGVNVDILAVAIPFRTLSAQAQQALIVAERSRQVELRYLAEDWGLASERSRPLLAAAEGAAPQDEPRDGVAPHFEISTALLQSYALRRYWIVKRAIDFSGAIVLITLFSPFIVLLAVLIAVDLGLPVLFWQQRPGLGGRTFRLYKFRTMRPGHRSDGSRLPDHERVSIAGKILRRLKLDELPQLFNIVRGDMSFIGPRPLLEQDQSEDHRARLLVRPGLTGWAQVVGGRDISPADKAALDVWYVCNASFALDTKILLRTIPIILFGERIALRDVERAWQELGGNGITSEENIRPKIENWVAPRVNDV